MRTTLTLDDDVVAKLKAETRRSGRSLKEVVNEYLRLGLHAKKPQAPHKPFRVAARDLGALRPGLRLDNVGDLLEQLEGPVHR
jgi:Ribbon-helix-helix protein, copG family